MLVLVLMSCTSSVGSNGDKNDDKDEEVFDCYEHIRATSSLPSIYKSVYDKYVQDNLNCDKRDLIVLTGSSTMALWESYKEDFAGYNVVNRSLDGCNVWYLTYCLDVIAEALQPRLLLVYTGDNDVAVYPENKDVYNDIQCFVNALFSIAPNVKLVFISVKPSPLREKLYDRYVELNSYFKSLSDSSPSIGYIDIWNPMFKSDGSVDSAFFRADRIHLSKEGYRLLTGKILDFLQQPAN